MSNDSEIEKLIIGKINNLIVQESHLKDKLTYHNNACSRIRQNTNYSKEFLIKKLEKMEQEKQSIIDEKYLIEQELDILRNPLHPKYSDYIKEFENEIETRNNKKIRDFEKKKLKHQKKVAQQQQKNIQKKIDIEKRKEQKKLEEKERKNKRGGYRKRAKNKYPVKHSSFVTKNTI